MLASEGELRCAANLPSRLSISVRPSKPSGCLLMTQTRLRNRCGFFCFPKKGDITCYQLNNSKNPSARPSPMSGFFCQNLEDERCVGTYNVPFVKNRDFQDSEYIHCVCRYITGPNVSENSKDTEAQLQRRWKESGKQIFNEMMGQRSWSDANILAKSKRKCWNARV